MHTFGKSRPRPRCSASASFWERHCRRCHHRGWETNQSDSAGGRVQNSTYLRSLICRVRLCDNFDDHLTIHLAVHVSAYYRIRKGNGCEPKKTYQGRLICERYREIGRVACSWWIMWLSTNERASDNTKSRRASEAASGVVGSRASKAASEIAHGLT